MSGLFHNRGFLLYCFLSTAASLKVSPPEKVRLGWNGVRPELSWTPPANSDHCTYQITSTVFSENNRFPRTYFSRSSPWVGDQSLNGGFLHISIQSLCNGVGSDPVSVSHDDPDLLLRCEIRSASLTHCSWQKPHRSANIDFFFKLYRRRGEAEDDVPLRECPLYTDNRTGCDLQMDTNQEIKVLLNGTANNRSIVNTYYFPFPKIKLAPLNWTVKESKEQFHINWDPPDFSHLVWEYSINYTACTKTMDVEVPSGLSYVLRKRMPECSYRISMRGTVVGTGETEWTPEIHFDAIAGPDLVLLTVLLIPVLMALLVVLSLMWCMKNKEKVFPKVPQPNPELFKDILNNSNKMCSPDFYLKKAEEECHVTLVVDPKLIRL